MVIASRMVACTSLQSYLNSPDLVFIPLAVAVNVATPPSLTVWLNGLTVMDNSSVQTQYNDNYY